MWSLMMQQLYCATLRREKKRFGNDEVAYEALPLARAGRNGVLHRAVEWVARQFAAWQELQDDLDRPTARRRPIQPGTPVGGVL